MRTYSRATSVPMERPSVRMTVMSGWLPARAVVHEWHKALLHVIVPDLIDEWAAKMGIEAPGYHLQRMKTKWGNCNPAKRHIRLNTELVKKPKDLLEYVVVHEMAHLLVPTHSEGFMALMDQHWPQWRESRAELNALPLAAESW